MIEPTIHHHDTSLHVPAVGISVLIFNQDEHVLLCRRILKHGPGTYGGPGGGLDHGETPPEGARREAMEEARLELDTLQLLCLTNFIIEGRHYLDVAFTATTTGTPVHVETDKHEPWQWHPLDNLPDPLFEPCRASIESYRTGNMCNW
jgi:8-oxo-dGTP diphosphatase